MQTECKQILLAFKREVINNTWDTGSLPVKINRGGVAQLVEQENHNLFVGGSSPSTATIIFKKISPFII